MRAHRQKLKEIDRSGLIFNAPAESVFRFGLIRHTINNPNRSFVVGRTSATWIGSHENYHMRIKRRWPIRFFLSYTLPPWLTYGPVHRILTKRQYAKHMRIMASERIALDEAIRAAIGNIPTKRGELFAKLSEKFPDHPDLVRRVDVSYGLSHNTIPRLMKDCQEAGDAIHPLPGRGTKLIVEYPEAECVRAIQLEIDRILRRIGRDAIELAELTNRREMIVVNQNADM